jgi:hypothetical protein
MNTTSSTSAPRRGRGKAKKNLDLIEAAYTILEAVQPATVRAVCYQLFNRRLIANMSKAETNRVSTQLRDAREAGTIPWEWIVDETRDPERVSAWENPEQYVTAVQRSYRRDRWIDQPQWVEVWSEKGTIRGTLAPILNDYGVTFRVMHGYGSATAIHAAAVETQQVGRRLTVFYVGDWDPSGLHMSEVDLPRRLREYDGAIDVQRVALVKDDTALLPSFDAETKRGDPRYGWFADHYGTRCWELDALSPVILRDRIEQAIADVIDGPAWERSNIAEQAEKESLSTILSRWPSISRQAPKYSPPDTARQEVEP